MSPPAIGAAGVLALFVLLFLRVPVWASLALVGFFGNLVLSGPQAAFALAGTTPFDAASAYTLSVIPLFVLMGEVLFHTGLAVKVIDGVERLISQVPGRLAVVAVVAGTVFSAISGSTIVGASVRHGLLDRFADALQIVR